MSPEELAARGERARQFLNDSLFQEAMQTLERDVFEAWSTCAIRDKEGQHELLLMIQTARKFKAIFENIVATGELAKADIKAPRLKRVLERFGVYS